MSLQPGFQALDARRQYLDAVRENGSRLATCFVTYTSTNWGNVTLPDVLYFTTTFVERPSVAYGSSVDGDTVSTGNYPIATGGVARWHRDGNGFYIGAWLWLVVESAQGNAFTVVHDLTFTGVAYKTIPQSLLAF